MKTPLIRLSLREWLLGSHLVVLAIPVAALAAAALVGGLREVQSLDSTGAVYALYGAALVPALIAATVLALAAGYFLTRSLSALSAMTRRISAGTFPTPADLAGPTASHVVEVGTLSEDIAAMSRRLEERLAYIAEFAGNVSHEFKTPITTLRGTVELLAEDEDMTAEQRAVFLSNARNELVRMELLVAGLLDLARAEQPPPAEVVDLDGLLAAAASRHPSIVATGQAGEVVGSCGQLGAVIDNLLDNARRHGGPDTAVRCEAWRQGDLVGLDVVDDGPGISPGNLPRIFDRFFTTDRAAGGVGLGLALAATIAAAHGGVLEATSRPGHTRFRLSLPAHGG